VQVQQPLLDGSTSSLLPWLATTSRFQRRHHFCCSLRLHLCHCRCSMVLGYCLTDRLDRWIKSSLQHFHYFNLWSLRVRQRLTTRSSGDIRFCWRITLPQFSVSLVATVSDAAVPGNGSSFSAALHVPTPLMSHREMALRPPTVDLVLSSSLLRPVDDGSSSAVSTLHYFNLWLLRICRRLTPIRSSSPLTSNDVVITDNTCLLW
jgi:hypothetical protein